MLTREENELLTRVGGHPDGAAYAALLVPGAAGRGVARAGGRPEARAVAGRRLVAYRAADGRVGLLAEYCPHRGASLAYGAHEDCGLRCIYHGWKIGVDGALLETPPEPPDSTFKNRLKHVAYATHEVADLIWVYMGHGSYSRPSRAFPGRGAGRESRGDESPTGLQLGAGRRGQHRLGALGLSALLQHPVAGRATTAPDWMARTPPMASATRRSAGRTHRPTPTNTCG